MSWWGQTTPFNESLRGVFGHFLVILPHLTYPLHAMWHIRPQHYPTNQLCQLLQFLPSCILYLLAFVPLYLFFHPAFSPFLSAVLLHVVFGLPLFRRPSGVQVNAILQSLFDSFLMIRTMNFHLLLHISPLRFSISAICRTSLFVIWLF